MTESLVKAQLGKLIELQKIDTEIYNCKKILLEKPEIVEKLKEDFENKKAKLIELQEKGKKIQVDRKMIELELQQKEETIAKGNSQLLQIKTNKDYTAKLSEIEHIKADKSIIEEKILLSYDEGDKVALEIDKEKQLVEVQEKEYLLKKKEVESEVKLVEDKLKVLEESRKSKTPEIDKVMLAKYEKILQHKNGLAIVALKGVSCGGCYMNVTTQMLNTIKMQADIVECEMCNRLIYIDNED